MWWRTCKPQRMTAPERKGGPTPLLPLRALPYVTSRQPETHGLMLSTVIWGSTGHGMTLQWLNAFIIKRFTINQQACLVTWKLIREDPPGNFTFPLQTGKHTERTQPLTSLSYSWQPLYRPGTFSSKYVTWCPNFSQWQIGNRNGPFLKLSVVRFPF